jgi:hypothetical protein
LSAFAHRDRCKCSDRENPNFALSLNGDADVAWMLGVSPSTSCRLLDRAERAGIVDKLYHYIDRRGTWARLTRRGVDLRVRVEHELDAAHTNERPRGAVWGIRGSIWDE